MLEKQNISDCHRFVLIFIRDKGDFLRMNFGKAKEQGRLFLGGTLRKVNKSGIQKYFEWHNFSLLSDSKCYFCGNSILINEEEQLLLLENTFRLSGVDGIGHLLEDWGFIVYEVKDFDYL